jgi:hypothetical protein
VKAPATSLRPGTKQVLLSFPGQELRRQGPKSLHETYTNRPFLPLGLMFWGATQDTFVTAVRVGNDMGLDASSLGMRLPALYFQAGKTFAELAALAEVGELNGAVELRQLVQLGVAYTGNTLRVEVEGPFESFCMWGLTGDGQAPLLAQIVSRELAGDRTTFECEGPTPEVVSGLLATFMLQR